MHRLRFLLSALGARRTCNRPKAATEDTKSGILKGDLKCRRMSLPTWSKMDCSFHSFYLRGPPCSSSQLTMNRAQQNKRDLWAGRGRRRICIVDYSLAPALALSGPLTLLPVDSGWRGMIGSLGPSYETQQPNQALWVERTRSALMKVLCFPLPCQFRPGVYPRGLRTFPPSLSGHKLWQTDRGLLFRPIGPLSGALAFPQVFKGDRVIGHCSLSLFLLTTNK